MINIATLIRIVSGIFILFLPSFSAGFYVWYFIGIGSYVVYEIAHRYKRSKDSAFEENFTPPANHFFIIAVVVKMVRSLSLPIGIWIWIFAIIAFKVINIIIGVKLMRKYVIERTVLYRITVVMMILCPIFIGTLPLVPMRVMVIITLILISITMIQDIYYIRQKKEI